MHLFLLLPCFSGHFAQIKFQICVGTGELFLREDNSLTDKFSDLIPLTTLRNGYLAGKDFEPAAAP
jgi:hypothetical protein